MRARKPKHIDEKLARYASIILDDPDALRGLRGQWAKRFFPTCRELRLDVGCGKGSFIVEAARLEPDVLFVGLDEERICIAMAAQKAFSSLGSLGQEGAPRDASHPDSNIRFALADANDIADYFAPGELDGIYLNFPTPWPKTKQARRRLVHADHLLRYRRILAADGIVRFKTDSQPLFDFALTQFKAAGYEIELLSRDLHARSDDGAALGLSPLTDFERRLMEKGARIHALLARPTQTPKLDGGRIDNDAPMGLLAYLPEDLDALEYLPHGMEDSIANMRNRKAKIMRAQSRRAR